VSYINALENYLLAFIVNEWQENLHASRAFGSEDIGFIFDDAVLSSHSLYSSLLLRIDSIIIEIELGAQEIGAHFTQIALGALLHLFLV
jgi:hypothetical protein